MKIKKLSVALRLAKASLLWMVARSMKILGVSGALILTTSNLIFGGWETRACLFIDGWVYTAAPSWRSAMGGFRPSMLVFGGSFLALMGFMWWARVGRGQAALSHAEERATAALGEASVAWRVQKERAEIEGAAKPSQAPRGPSRRL